MTRSPEKLSELLAELKAEYLKALPGKIEKLKTLTLAKDWQTLSDEYHKMKGTGKTYGFPEISQVCEKMEFLSLHHQSHQTALFRESLELLERMRQNYELGQSYDLKADPAAQVILRLKSV